MLTVIKRLSPVYMIFLGILLGYLLISQGFHPSMIGVIIDVSVIFLLVAFIMCLMGRPPKGMECIEKFHNATIDEGVVLNRRKLRRWVSSSFCINDKYLVICTFRKIKELAKKEDISDVYTEGATLVVEFSGKKWYLSCDDADNSFKRVQRFLKEDEN